MDSNRFYHRARTFESPLSPSSDASFECVDLLNKTSVKLECIPSNATDIIGER